MRLSSKKLKIWPYIMRQELRG